MNTKQQIDQFNRVKMFLFECRDEDVDIHQFGPNEIYAVIGPYEVKCEMLDQQRFRVARDWYNEYSKVNYREATKRWQRFLQRYVALTFNSVGAKDVEVRLIKQRRR